MATKRAAVPRGLDVVDVPSDAVSLPTLRRNREAASLQVPWGKERRLNLAGHLEVPLEVPLEVLGPLPDLAFESLPQDARQPRQEDEEDNERSGLVAKSMAARAAKRAPMATDRNSRLRREKGARRVNGSEAAAVARSRGRAIRRRTAPSQTTSENVGFPSLELISRSSDSRSMPCGRAPNRHLAMAPRLASGARPGPGPRLWLSPRSTKRTAHLRVMAPGARNEDGEVGDDGDVHQEGRDLQRRRAGQERHHLEGSVNGAGKGTEPLGPGAGVQDLRVPVDEREGAEAREEYEKALDAFQGRDGLQARAIAGSEPVHGASDPGSPFSSSISRWKRWRKRWRVGAKITPAATRKAMPLNRA